MICEVFASHDVAAKMPNADMGDVAGNLFGGNCLASRALLLGSILCGDTILGMVRIATELANPTVGLSVEGLGVDGDSVAACAEKTVIEVGNLVRSGAAVSYGEKTIVAGKEMLPVALAFYHFGSGAGNAEGIGRAAGHGVGGQSLSIPLGAYIADAEGKLQFEPNIIALCTVAIPLALAGGAATAKIIRAFRR